MVFLPWPTSRVAVISVATSYSFNLIDWSLRDRDLLEIRDAGAFARTLDPLTKEKKSDLRFWNYMFVLIALAVVFVLALTRRKLVQPIELKEGGR